MRIGFGMKYATLRTRLGWLAVARSERGLCLVGLPRPSLEEALSLIQGQPWGAHEDLPCFGDLLDRLKSYFEGERTEFRDTIDPAIATPFQMSVWESTRLIPYGETRSYNWVAERAGRPRAWRAAGSALARNPVPIVVPCHRVLSHDGSLGGFSGGLELKEVLLSLEAGVAGRTGQGKCTDQSTRRASSPTRSTRWPRSSGQ